MTVEADTGWERHPNGSYISIPVYHRDLDAVRAWGNENREGDFLLVLGPRVVFQLRGDAALATLYWRAEER